MAKRKGRVKEIPRHLKYVPKKKTVKRRTGIVGTYYKGSELVLARIDGKVLLLSLEQLYERYINNMEDESGRRDMALFKYVPRDNPIEIWDSISNDWTFLIRGMKIPRNKNAVMCIEMENGVTRIGHPYFHYVDEEANNRACILKVGDSLTVTPSLYSGQLPERTNVIWALEAHPGHRRASFRGRPFYGEEGEETRLNGQVTYVAGNNHIQNRIPIDRDLGWLVGMALSSGFIAANAIRIVKQNDYMIDKLTDILEDKLIGYSVNTRVDNNASTVIIKSRIFADIVQNLFGEGFNDKTSSLNPNILSYNDEFLRGIVGGIVDGDGRLNEDCTAVDVHCHSRVLMNQLAFLARMLGHTAIERTPDELSAVRKDGLKPTATYRYYVSYTPGDKEIGTGSILETYITDGAERMFRGGLYGVQSIKELVDDKDKFLYDIATESGYFNCNNIASYSFSGYKL